AAMGHNVVFLKSDVDTNAFVTAAAKAPDYDYIPQDKLDEILATTNLLGPGESDTIEFTAPEPGEYTYVCSFPAHLFAGMVGVMEVVAAE
ncbi:MAG: plastocyanin/azurin family copper-binding protein, partial [Verrucomicrobiota bacterium]